MNIEEAREILKPYEAYKVFPLYWMSHDEHGNRSCMSTAEAKGFLEGHKAALESEAVKGLIGTLALLSDKTIMPSKERTMIIEALARFEQFKEKNK